MCQWACTVCTFENSTFLTRCEQCDTAPPSAAAAMDDRIPNFAVVNHELQAKTERLCKRIAEERPL